MNTKKIKAVHLVQDGDVFQVIGVYRKIGNIHRMGENSRDESDSEYVTLSESKYYHRERREMMKIAHANSVEPFDLVGEAFVNTLAKLKKG